jgi:hypothetical protein
MLPLNLYARVRFCLRIWHARPRVQRAPGLPCALSFRERDIEMQTSGEPRRETAKSRLVVGSHVLSEDGWSEAIPINVGERDEGLSGRWRA